MSMAIMQLRLLTLKSQINKNQAKLSRLQETLNIVSTTNSNNERLYSQCFLFANGIDSTLSEEKRQLFSEQLGELQPIIELMDDKANNIDLEIQAINSELAAENNELKTVQKWIEDNAKKETAHYTMS